jgi:apolipoprotein N-acyltransferase
VALVPLLWVLLPPERNVPAGQAFRLGYFFGVAFFLILLHWIPRLPPENVTVPFLMYPALLIMVAYLSLYPAFWAMGVVVLCRRTCPYLLAAVAPSLWIVLEWIRNLGIVGFPWGALGYSQWASRPLVQFASFGGFWSVSFWIVLVNVTAFLVLRYRGRPRLAAAGATLLLFILPWLYGRSVLQAFDAAPSEGQPVVLIQQNTGNDKWNPNQRSEVIQNLVNMTLEAAPQSPENAIVIWPETATPTLLLQDGGNFALVQGVAAQVRRPILTGFPDRRLFRDVDGKDIEARYYNAAGLLIPGRGVVETYAKIKLVPFSEWMPVPGLNRVNFGQSNFTPGDSLLVFQGLKQWPKGSGHRFGVLICYESIFPGMSRALIRSGADFLVNVTNDQWFGRSPAPYQHLTMCVFRAIENRVGIARAANTGVTCLIDPTGRIQQATELFQPAVVQGNVQLVKGQTFYTRYGDWILGVAALAIAVGVGLKVRYRKT